MRSFTESFCDIRCTGSLDPLRRMIRGLDKAADGRADWSPVTSRASCCRFEVVMSSLLLEDPQLRTLRFFPG
jgi:hypothetical protein